MNRDIYAEIVFREFKNKYYGLTTIEELEMAKKDYNIISNDFGVYRECIENFLSNKQKEFKKDSLNRLIKPIEELEPLIFNIKGLNDISNKIDKLNDHKLKFEFRGLFNLLSDEKNLVYNDLYTRKRIVKDLNKFKSLKFFKVNYLSRYNLKNEYKYLHYKNKCMKGHSKIYYIRSGLYVLQTLNHDGISLKVFYIGKRYKILLKSSNDFKRTLKGEKFNLSSTEAYKVLDKKDNMKYYSYCNNMGLDKTNRRLLKSIRKSKRISRDSLIESLEDRKTDILEDIKISSELQVLYLEIELQDIEEKLQELKTLEEDNSMDDKTSLNDYF